MVTVWCKLQTLHLQYSLSPSFYLDLRSGLGFKTKHVYVSVGLPRVYVDFNLNHPSILKVNACAAFVDVCRLNPQTHHLGCLSELLGVMLVDPVVVWLPWLKLHFFHPP